MKVKVFEIVKTGLAPLKTWLNNNKDIEILTASQSQHLRGEYRFYYHF